MQLTQLTDAQLQGCLDRYADLYLASCALDYDFTELEACVDRHYAEAERRGVFN